MAVSAEDLQFMEQALLEAHQGAAWGEVPVGAVIVYQGQIIARAYNFKENGKDATLHCEMVAIREACRYLGGWRLTGATLYVTLEPCPMCAGAMVQARLSRLVFGAYDPKSGAAGSLLDLTRFPGFNHQLIVDGGILAEESSLLLKDFFQKKRKNKLDSKLY